MGVDGYKKFKMHRNLLHQQKKKDMIQGSSDGMSRLWAGVDLRSVTA